MSQRDPGAADVRTGRSPFAALAVFLLGSVFLVGAFIVHVMQGPADIGVSVVLRAIFAYEPGLEHEIVRHLRFPRAVSGILAGAAMAVAGALLQTATRNPLASPATLGVNAGAFLAVVVAAALFPGAGGLPSFTLAFVGGLAAAGASILVAGGVRATPVRLALAGMAVAMALAAAAAVLQIFFEEETSGLFFWGSGTLLQNGWGRVQDTLPFLVPALFFAFAISRQLDVLRLGDDTARGLGQHVGRWRIGSTVLAVFLAATAVSLTGPIGFIGLVAPHLVRLMGVRQHLGLLTGSALWGAALLAAADVAGRLFAGGLSEVPAGVVTAMIGTPFLIYLAHRLPHEREPVTERGPVAEFRPPYALVLAGSGVALSCSVLVALLAGAVDVPWSAFVEMLLGGGSATHRFILFDLRLPRVLVAALAGAALAASGLLLQGVVRNPLAAPELVGVTSGAGVGAMVLLVVAPSVPVAFLPLAAFGGAVGAFVLVYLAAWRGGVSPERLALVGIGVSALGAAVINLLVVRSDMQIARALVWLSGSTYAQGWGDLIPLAVLFFLLVPAAWIAARYLDILALGDDGAAGVGLQVERARLVHVGLAVALAAVAVATVGTVGFVGLVAPHAARLFAGGRHRDLVPLALLFGALILVVADVTGRTVLAPRQIPSGLVAAMIGAPYFLWLLRRHNSSV